MNDTFNTIRDNLRRYYIFYISSSLKNAIQHTLFVNSLTELDYDVFAYFNKDCKIVRGSVNSFSLEMIEKALLLEQNIFLLFDKKKYLSQNEFSYLLDKYLDDLIIYARISQWLNTNLAASFHDVQHDLKPIFELQAQYFNKHLQEIKDKFKNSKVSENINEKDLLLYFKNHFNAKKNLPLDQKIVETENLNFKALTPIAKSKKEKKILVTDEETDAFLLETVFNVNIRANK